MSWAHPIRTPDLPIRSKIRDAWFRDRIWRPALTASDLEFKVKMHDLRHAHAPWLLAGGADPQVVKERLGHGSVSTTEKHLLASGAQEQLYEAN